MIAVGSKLEMRCLTPRFVTMASVPATERGLVPPHVEVLPHWLQGNPGTNRLPAQTPCLLALFW